ncbi:MAG: hypothetical protein AAFZ15_09730 [Bacteroidota bacterium]
MKIFDFQIASPEQYFLSFQIDLAGPDGQPFKVPLGGALGLLAAGDIGTIAWRQKLQQVKSEMAERTQTHLAEGE